MGKTGSCSEGWAMLSKSLFQFSVEGQGCVPSLLFDLRPNCGGGNEDNGGLLLKVLCTHCHTQHPQPCSRPPPTHASTGDSWTLTGKSGSISYGDTVFFSWLLVCTSFCLCPPRVCFPSPVEVLQTLITIKSHWPPKSSSLGVLSLFAGSSDWEICCQS